MQKISWPLDGWKLLELWRFSMAIPVTFLYHHELAFCLICDLHWGGALLFSGAGDDEVYIVNESLSGEGVLDDGAYRTLTLVSYSFNLLA